MMDAGILIDLGVIIISATILGMVAKLLKQPLILSYILAGIIIGPEFLGIITNIDIINAFAEFGMALLLFMVALELDFSRLKEVGKVVVVTGTVQIILIFLVTFVVAQLFGFKTLSSVYLGLFLAFSSTAILMKLLSDKNEVDTLHGRIILGVLLVQDIAVVLVLSVLYTINIFSVDILLSSILKGLGLFAMAVVLSKFILPGLFRLFRDSSEMIFLLSLTILFLFALISYQLGLSIAVGGFLAGISIPMFPFNIEIAGRTRSLRDFFIIIFFVSLGMLISMREVTFLIFPVFVFLLITMLLKPFIIYVMVQIFGYGRKTSFMSSVSMGQISEFSLIIAMTGLTLGHISSGVFSIAAMIMLLTAVITTYFVEYDRNFYSFFSRFLFDLKKNRETNLDRTQKKLKDHFVICGAHIKGHEIIKKLKELKEDLIVVDYDPSVIEKIKEQGIPFMCGDATDPEVLERLNLDKIKTMISTIPDVKDNRLLVRKVKEINPKANIVMTANNYEDALLLYEEGADYVIFPKMLAGERISNIVETTLRSKKKMKEIKARNIKKLEELEEDKILDKFEPEFLKDLKDKFKI